MIERIDVWTDGAVAPVNPGGALGWGFVVDRNGQEIKQDAGYEDPAAINTSPRAEYIAICMALAYLKKEGFDRHQVRFNSDNLMVVRQMSGLWKIKSPDAPYVVMHKVAKKLATQFRDLTFTWIPREENQRADILSKKHFEINGIEIKEEANASQKKKTRTDGVQFA